MKAYVRGVGRTKFGILEENLPQLSYHALSLALKDADMHINEIDAIYVSNFLGGEFQKQLHQNSLVSSLLPGLMIPIVRIETACASGGSSFFQSILGLSRFKNILVMGVEKMSNAPAMKSAEYISMAGDRDLDQVQGLIFPAGYALVAQQHMNRYGTTPGDLSLVSLKSHKNANLNPLAHFYTQDVSLEDIETSPMVSSPLKLFHCSPLSDGACALVVSAERKSDRDIEIIGSDLSTDSISLAERRDITTFPAAKRAGMNAFRRAGLSPSDVDLAQVHDCFAIAELLALEDLGFCKPGESKDFVRDGSTSLKGDIPVNTDGGLKADGHPIGASGLAQIFEIVMQLRCEAGKRQVANANIGLAHNVGGVGGTAVVSLFRRS